MEAPVTLAGLFALLDAIRQALESGDIDRLGRLVGEYRSGINAFIATPATVVARYDELDHLLRAHLRMQDLLSAARNLAIDQPGARGAGMARATAARLERA